MIQSRNWSSIERLPDDPTVAKMTGNGYWLGGRFYPSRPETSATGMDQPRKGWLDRVLGR